MEEASKRELDAKLRDERAVRRASQSSPIGGGGHVSDEEGDFAAEDLGDE